MSVFAQYAGVVIILLLGAVSIPFVVKSVFRGVVLNDDDEAPIGDASLMDRES